MAHSAFQASTSLLPRHGSHPHSAVICTRSPPSARVTTVSPSQLSKLLAASHRSSNIVVLKCYADYCRSCKGVEPKFRKIAAAYQSDQPDQPHGPNITFCQMDYALNESFCKETLGVHTLPFFSIWKDGHYVNGEAIGWQSINRKLVHNIDALVKPTLATAIS